MPSLEDLLPDADLSDPIALLAAAEFRWGDCQAITYDPRRTDIFSQPFLFNLYERTRLSGVRHPLPLDLNNRGTLGPLPTMYCGMTNLGPDAVCKYLSERAVCVVGEWRDADAFCEFEPLGYCFPSTAPVTTPYSNVMPSNSVFAGYTIFSEAWRKPQQRVLMFLGLAWLFHTFKLAAIHGSRLETNHLTARWTRQFGFKDCGTLPHCMAGEPGGPLVPGVFSTLLREDFEALLRAVLEQIRTPKR